jgi:DNA-binding CsgD family transcriptional regulator
VLQGRASERAELGGLLETVRAGRGASLLIHGPPGIGKTALLDWLAGSADGVRVLRAAGFDAERPQAFAGLADLLRPVLELRDQLPPSQASLLAAALGEQGEAGPATPFAVGVAGLALLAAAARERPVLALVDDAHWLDDSSREALAVASRRLAADPVALVLTARPEEDALQALSSVPALELGGVDERVARALLRGSADGLAPAVADRLVEAAAGSPLGLVEVAAQLTPAQRAGREPLPEPLPVGRRLAHAWDGRLAALSAGARQAALLLAAAQPEDAPSLDGAALAELEAAGLVTVTAGRPAFVHPLVRSAVYHAATPAERRAAHATLAGPGGDPADARRAWHRAAAAALPDEDVAAGLELAGEGAARHGDQLQAARLYQRAAELSPDDEAGAGRLLRAARCYELAGRTETAMALLDAALPRTRNSLRTAAIQRLRARVEGKRGNVVDAHALLTAEAARIAAEDPGEAAAMLADAAILCLFAGETQRGLDTAEQAVAAADGNQGRPGAAACLALGAARLLLGEVASGAPLLAEGVERVERLGLKADEAELVMVAAVGLAWLDELERACELLAPMVVAQRGAGVVASLAETLDSLAQLEDLTGRWTAAYAHATEAVDLSGELVRPFERAYSLSALAHLDAQMGAEELCRAHAAEALELTGGTEMAAVGNMTSASLGLLELGLGRPEAALEHLDAVRLRLEEQGGREPPLLNWRGDRIEALVQLGRLDEARAGLEALQEQARATGRGWVQSAAARSEGLLASESGFDEPFARAVELGRSVTPLLRGRTRLLWGERLRRAGRDEEARTRLHEALVVFDVLGAEPWAARARRELAACGERVAGAAPSLRAALTGQELQVVLVVAEGLRNREAAARLFVTPKTIEFHLSNVYRKLRIRSRAELVRRVAMEAEGLEAR